MANYNKYINSTGTHYIANSGSDEKGNLHSGTAGDQTGKEWQLRSWYNRPWTHVFRYEKDSRVPQKLAELGCAAALNDNIGYDQHQRTTYWTQLKAANYDPSKIKTPCEEDCSAGVAANVKAVGFLLGIKALQEVSSSMTSRNTVQNLTSAGFTMLTDSKYLTSGKYLQPGDILLYINHHVAMNITKGTKAEATIPRVEEKLEVIGTAVSKGSMFVRPSETSAANYGAVAKGATVNVVELLSSGWMKIEWSKSPTGYGYTSNRNNKYYTYTAKNAEEFYITTGRVNIRKGAGTNYSSMTVLPNGTKTTYLNKEETINGVKWLYVSCVINNKSYTGWVSSKYLKRG